MTTLTPAAAATNAAAVEMLKVSAAAGADDVHGALPAGRRRGGAAFGEGVQQVAQGLVVGQPAGQ
ncbi:hypothetical protein [Streptomyces manipurensis]|uniref:hypothetical protein n=1 Tax=Streptomyces manipurensis TaxID=1077945 RepID=UPI003C7003CA